MKKLALATSLLVGSVILPMNAVAADACASIVCLGGFVMTGGKGGDSCKKPIDDYFDIKKYKKKKFLAGSTIKARRDYLNQCETASQPEKDAIQARYGSVPDNPGSLY